MSCMTLHELNSFARWCILRRCCLHGSQSSKPVAWCFGCTSVVLFMLVLFVVHDGSCTRICTAGLVHAWCCLWFMLAYIPGVALQVTVDRPDVQGRVRILKVHSRGKQIGKDVDFEKIARRTPGVYNPLSNTCVHTVSGADSYFWANFNAQQSRVTLIRSYAFSCRMHFCLV